MPELPSSIFVIINEFETRYYQSLDKFITALMGRYGNDASLGIYDLSTSVLDPKRYHTLDNLRTDAVEADVAIREQVMAAAVKDRKRVNQRETRKAKKRLIEKYDYLED